MEEEVEKKVEEKERELLAQSEVSLLMNGYNDIFSSFDPRPYSQRALSVDFLDEARRATRELGEGGFQLRILMPVAQRRVEKELVIKKRLKEHFKKHADKLEHEKRKILMQGFYFIVIGIIFMFIASFILFHYTQRNLMKEFLVVLLQPGGWFLFWEGLNLMIFESRRIKPDLEFYRKMIRAEITFSHYK